MKRSSILRLFSFPICSLLAVALLLPGDAGAAGTSAGIIGVVRDPDGNTIEGVEIELRERELGTKQLLKSDKKGKFSHFALRPGVWDIVARKEGFAETVAETQLRLGDRPNVELIIVPGRVAPKGEPVVSFSVAGVELTKEAAEAYQEAQTAMSTNDKPATRAALARVIALEPSMAQPYFLIGQLEREAGEANAALEHLKKGLELKPDESTGWIALGEIQLEANTPNDALVSFRKASDLAPGDARAWKKIGNTLVMNADYANAIAPLETYLSLAPGAADAGEVKGLLDELKKLAAKSK